jgi:hypothetical protein
MAMGTRRLIAALCAGSAALVLLAAARPATLAETAPGLWEISGFPKADATARQCVADTATLAVFENSGQNCEQVVISDTPSTTVIEYNCGNGSFGRTKLTLLTPRSLRIETQGISAKYPFNYTIQARRVGDCPPH